jgi:crotonobetainyl-CoA:carnitine CoA-transferase CaiB-like acyl-CoA transferase
VLVENFRPGVMDRLGLGYETLAARNPGLVYCASSGYGPDGPYLTRPGQDLLAQSLAGLPWLQGNAGDAPTPVGIGIADLAAGLHIAYAVLAALIHRDRTGQGQRVDVNLLNSIVAMQAQELTWYLHTREVPQRSSAGIGSPFVGAPLGIYRTADGWIALAMNDVSTVAGLVGATVDLPEPGKNVMAGRDTIKAALDQAIADWQTTPLLEHLLAADIWCAPVQDYPAVVADPQLAHNEMIRTIRHPSVGDYQTIGPPVRFSHTPSTIERPPPLLGQHTDDLLREVCGLTPDQIADLHHRGAVRAAEEPSP